MAMGERPGITTRPGLAPFSASVATRSATLRSMASMSAAAAASGGQRQQDHGPRIPVYLQGEVPGVLGGYGHNHAELPHLAVERRQVLEQHVPLVHRHHEAVWAGRPGACGLGPRQRGGQRTRRATSSGAVPPAACTVMGGATSAGLPSVRCSTQPSSTAQAVVKSLAAWRQPGELHLAPTGVHGPLK